MTAPADVITPAAPPPGAPLSPQTRPSRRSQIFKRGLLLELIIVTAGVLIALSVDTIREWRSHESLANEARATMLAEVAQNRQVLQAALDSLGATRQTYIAVLGEARARLAGRSRDLGNVNLNFKMAPLSSAAYTTAEITGALGYMEYDDVRRFAGVYEAQRRYQTLQDQFAVDLWAVVTPMMFGGDLSGARRQDLEAWIRGLENLLAGVLTLQGFGEGLRQAYVGILEPR